MINCCFSYDCANDEYMNQKIHNYESVFDRKIKSKKQIIRKTRRKIIKLNIKILKFFILNNTKALHEIRKQKAYLIILEQQDIQDLIFLQERKSQIMRSQSLWDNDS